MVLKDCPYGGFLFIGGIRNARSFNNLLDSNYCDCGDYMGNYKKYLAVLLVVAINFSTTYSSFASTSNPSIGGWNVVSNVASGIGRKITASKEVMINGASKTMTGVANVTPTAGQVGKFIAKNAGAAAVIGAMDLLLDGVDWVMDPANNSVTYPPKDNSITPQPWHKNQYTCSLVGFSACTGGKTFASMTAIGNAMAASDGQGITTCSMVSLTGGQCIGSKNGRKFTFTMSPNPTYDQSKEEERKVTVPLSNIGEQVINQAETEVKAGNPAQAAAVTQAAAAAVVGEAEKDEATARPIVQQLADSASIPTDETAQGEITAPSTNPDTGEVKPGSISLEFPEACSYAPTICQAADVVIQAPAAIKDYLKEQESDSELDIDIPEQENILTEINFDSSCPEPITTSGQFNGKTVTFEFSFDLFCTSMSKYVKPIVISLGAFHAVLIVSGVRMNG